MKRKILILLATVLIMSAMSALLGVNAADEKYDVEAIQKSYLETSYASPAEKLMTMDEQMTSPSGEYTLYIEKVTGEMAIKNNKTGQILFSNPYDVASKTIPSTGSNITDELKKELLSQITLNYTTISTGASANMTSFQEAAMRINEETGANQIVIKKISGGVRVEYTLGRTETRVLAPRQISKERFEECILKPIQEAAKEAKETLKNNPNNKEIQEAANEAIFLASKFIGSKGEQVLYTLKDPDAPGVSERSKKAMHVKYPITKKMPVYVLSSDISQYQLVNWLEKAINNYTTYTFEDMAADHSQTNYTGTDVAPPLFRIAIEYYLDDDGLTYRVPANGIRFDSTLYRLTDVTILPYLGAGTSTDDGYTFIPDGSGAIINFKDVANSGKITLGGKIYGQDYAYYNLSGANQEIIRFPVFGTVVDRTETTSVAKKVPVLDDEGNQVLDASGNPVTEIVYEEVKTVTSNGVLSIITEGEAIGSIYTQHGGQTHPYHSVYATYVPRPNDKYALNQFSESSTSMWTVVTDRRYTGNISVKVIMLDGKAASYSGMASAYRDYLYKQGELAKLEKVDENLPLFIESFGAIEVTERILGIPVNVKKELTSFDNLQTMVKELKEKGIGRVNIKYQAWANNAFESTPFTKLKIEGATGGKAGLKEFLAFASENNAYLYPDVELTYAYNLSIFDGFDYNKMISRRVDKRVSFKLEYDDEYQGFMLWAGDVISPQFMESIWSKIEEKYAALGIGGISAGYIGSDLNSDHNKKQPINRAEAQVYVEQVLAQIKQSAGNVLVNGGNAYALKDSELIVDAPLESSRYVQASREVPFYAMVVHGSRQFAGSPLNSAPDYEAAVLKVIESGALPYFRVSYQNTNELKSNKETSKYFSVDYMTWSDDIVETYHKINDAIGDLQNVYIKNHEAITNKTVCVTYENGVEIFVNYAREKVYIYKNEFGKYAVSYDKTASGKVIGLKSAKDENGRDIMVEEEFDLELEVPEYGFVRRGDK